MRRRIRWLMFVTVTSLAAWYFWLRPFPGDYANYPPVGNGPWVAFGDSLTEGFGASEGKDYPAVLSQQLGIHIVNLGKSGDTTAEALQRLEEASALNPRVVLLCLGGNDSLQKLSRTQMIANLGAMIDRFQQGGAFVVLIGVRSATLRDHNEKLFRNLARQKKVFYVPNIHRGIFPKPIYMSDALHPNDEGYRLIAERLAKELHPLLPKLKSVGDALH